MGLNTKGAKTMTVIEALQFERKWANRNILHDYEVTQTFKVRAVSAEDAMEIVVTGFEGLDFYHEKTRCKEIKL